MILRITPSMPLSGLKKESAGKVNMPESPSPKPKRKYTRVFQIECETAATKTEPERKRSKPQFNPSKVALVRKIKVLTTVMSSPNSSNATGTCQSVKTAVVAKRMLRGAYPFSPSMRQSTPLKKPSSVSKPRIIMIIKFTRSTKRNRCKLDFRGLICK